jgi:molecular chaperone GrpE
MININKEVDSLLDNQDKSINSDEATNDTLHNDEVNGSLNEEILDEADVEIIEVNPLLDKISALENQLEEANNKYLRLQADFENSRRRSRLDYESALKYGSQSLISNFLPTLDNFERALNIEPENEQAKSILQGVEMVYKQLQQTLLNEGLEVIDAVGQQFDPYIHQAVMQINDENYESNTVVEELQKGYKLKDKIIRPSMVKVNA